MKKYEVHELANLFPMMDEKTREALKKDIETNGQIEPIIIYRDEEGHKWLLDGRNRESICSDLGIEPKYKIITFEEVPDAMAYVMSLNLHRRQLADYQRVLAAARAIPFYEKEAKERQKAKQKRAQICAQLMNVKQKRAQICAQLMNVKTRNVEYARKVLKSENQQLIAKVDSGLIPISLASKIVTHLTPEEQAQVIDKPKKDIVQAINKKLGKETKQETLKKPKSEQLSIQEEFANKLKEQFLNLRAIQVCQCGDHVISSRSAEEVIDHETLLIIARQQNRAPFEFRYEDLPGVR